MRLCFQGNNTKKLLGQHKIIDRLIVLAKKSNLT